MKIKFNYCPSAVQLIVWDDDEEEVWYESRWYNNEEEIVIALNENNIESNKQYSKLIDCY